MKNWHDKNCRELKIERTFPFGRRPLLYYFRGGIIPRIGGENLPKILSWHAFRRPPDQAAVTFKYKVFLNSYKGRFWLV